MKKVLMVIGVLIAIAVGTFAILTFLDLGKEKDILKEFDEINQAINKSNPDYDWILAKCKETVSTGDYEKVEIAAKKYLTDFVNITKDMVAVFENDDYANLLTAQNYQNDGPKFTKSRAQIKEAKEEIANYKEEYEEFITNEKIMSYLDGVDVDDYYQDFYREQLIGDVSSTDKKEIEESFAYLNKVLDGTVKIYDFLETNAGNWQVVGDSVSFSSNELVNQYNNLVKDLQQ